MASVNDEVKLKFSRGVESALSSTAISEGFARVATDTKSLYFDIDGKRVEITDFIEVASIAALNDILTPVSKKFYYAIKENLICKYTSNGWATLNSTGTSSKDLSVTIGTTDWVSGTNEYTKVIDLDGISEEDSPVTALDGTTFTDEQITSYDSIKYIETLENQIKVHATSAFTAEITLKIFSVPDRSISMN